MDGAGRARITDFCLTVVTTDVDSNLSASLLHRNTQRWTAPEVLNGGKYSKKSDIFSLAMVTTEVCQMIHGVWSFGLRVNARSCSPMRFLSVPFHRSWLCWQSHKGNGRHGQRIQLSQKICGN